MAAGFAYFQRLSRVRFPYFFHRPVFPAAAPGCSGGGWVGLVGGGVVGGNEVAGDLQELVPDAGGVLGNMSRCLVSREVI